MTSDKPFYALLFTFALLFFIFTVIRAVVILQRENSSIVTEITECHNKGGQFSAQEETSRNESVIISCQRPEETIFYKEVYY